MCLFFKFKIFETSRKMNPELNFTFHKSFDGYVAKLNIPKDVVKESTAKPDFVLLLDRSGSMGQNVDRIISKILPASLAKLGYSSDDTIYIVTYDTCAQSYRPKVKELSIANIRSRGSTYLVPGLQHLDKTFQFLGDKVRLLHISDGNMRDINSAVQFSEQIHKSITNGRQINSQAIRYMTGGEPDTRGLSSTLKFGNTIESKLLDVPYATDSIGFERVATEIFEQFNNDGLCYKIEMTIDENLIMNNPWDVPVSQSKLNIGDNTVWFKEMPKSIAISGIDAVVKPELSEQVNLTNINTIMEQRINYYMDRIRILKVVGSDSSKEEIAKILDYFSQFQTYLNTFEMTQNTEYSPGLKFRFNTIKRNIQQQRRSLFMKLKQLANDDIVSQLNSAQQAEYLRGVDLSKNSKGLAKRAMKTGFDLTDVVQKEIKEIHKHIKELEDIDDSEHLKSFYSMETTLEGLKTLAELVDDDLLSETTVADIIQLTNVVGIACNHPIGDYPDAMAFRIHDVFPGVYISVSDITVCQTMSSDGKLKPPGFPDKEIANTIPVFDDVRIHQFMLKHCPTLLNLVSGVGMRRVLADVPSTHMYTVCAGLWKTIDMFAENRSEILMKTIKQLADTYDIDVGIYFDHNEAFLVDQDTKTSYFINNNGLTNMINLLHRQYKKGNTKNMPRIIRAIYCYEFYQTIKKIIAKADDKLKFVSDTLVDLLGLDYDKYGTQVGDAFTETPKPSHDKTWNANTKLLHELTNRFEYFKNLYMAPLVFEALEAPGNYLDNLKQIPVADDKLLLNTIKVEYDLEKFLVYSAVESIIYHTKQLRVSDKNTKQMNLPDIGFISEANKMVNTFIINHYQKSYNKNLREKTKIEYEMTLREMNKHLIETDIETYIEVLSKGFQYKHRTAQIVNTCSEGFSELGQLLLSTDLDVKDRFRKLYIYLLGKDSDGNVIWNGGNAVRVDLAPYKQVFEHFGQMELWETFTNTYSNSVKHTYRGGEEYANRHGHHNDKPSYWALGYKTVNDMEGKVSEEEYNNYAVIHSDCCGFNDLSLYQRKKMARKNRAKSGTNTLDYY